MKTVLVSLFTASLLCLAAIAGGRLFDAADFVAILFTAGLVGWTAAQYQTVPRSLSLSRPIYLSMKTGAAPTARTLATRTAA